MYCIHFNGPITQYLQYILFISSSYPSLLAGADGSTAWVQVSWGVLPVEENYFFLSTAAHLLTEDSDNEEGRIIMQYCDENFLQCCLISVLGDQPKAQIGSIW